MASIKRRADGQWRARYRDPAGREHAKHFARKTDAQTWLDTVTTAVVTGTYVDPRTAKTSVKAWCDTWLAGYETRRPSTVRQAKVHVAQIVAEFGPLRLADVRPSHVRSWTSRLAADGVAPSYVYALHSRLSQIMSDAVHDGIVARNPCSRRTSPGAGEQRAYVATTKQVWALHDAMPERYRAAVLLGAFTGLRVAEACGLRVADVDFLRGTVTPAVQYPSEPLKTEGSVAAIPVPTELTEALAAHVARWRAETILTNTEGGQLAPWTLERAMRTARGKVEGLAPTFRYQAGPAALLRQPAHRLRCRREGRPGPAAAPLRQDHPRRLRAPVAGLGRRDEDRCRDGPRRSCGLSAD